MKKIPLLLLCIFTIVTAFAQRPSKEQMEKDKKAYAEAQRELKETLSKMNPEARRQYDSLTNALGAGAKMNEANQKINATAATSQKINASVGLVPQKNIKAIAGIANTPSNAGMGAFVETSGNSIFGAAIPAAKNKANEIYKVLKEKGANADEKGNAAIALWMMGRTQIALCVMEHACSDDANNTDNLGNYASMLTMMGAPEMAIPILNNLNARFKKNTTILNNLGQAWFALGDMDKSAKYLDSTLAIAPFHSQANETRCLIDESKGNKKAAVAHAKAAFKQSNTSARKDKLKQLGYLVGGDDYNNNFPPANKSDDLLNLGNFIPIEFPKSYAAQKIYLEQRKQFAAEIDSRQKLLKKITDESKKQTTKRMEEQGKQMMKMRDKILANPGSVNAGEAMQVMDGPMFSEKMNARENLILENLQKRKASIQQKMADFIKGEGADYKKNYDATMSKINDRWKDAREGGTENNEVLCVESVKAVDAYLSAFNTRYEELYKQYLIAEKQWMNEFSYSSLYNTYPELMPGINAGLQSQWLTDLSFKAATIDVSYGCTSDGKIKEGKLTTFKDPNCNINSEFNVGIGSFGGSIKLDCNGMTTTFNAGAAGFTLNQDLDHAGFGDSFKNCTVSIGPKVSAGGKVGPLEANLSAGVGADIEIDRNGISDVVVKGGVEAETGIGPVSTGAGVEGRMSLNTGVGSVQGTGMFK